MATIPWPWDRQESAPHTDRLPPQNLEAEMGVIGSVLLEPSTLSEVKKTLRGPEDFFRDTHQTLYRMLLLLEGQQRPIDAVTLSEELTRHGHLAEVGGIDVVAEIVAQVPHSANARYYAEIVRQKAETRDLIDAASEILRDGYSNQVPSSAILARAKLKFARIEEEIGDHGWQEPETGGSLPALPFPLDVLPLGLQRFVTEVSSAVPCPPDFAAVPALAVAGTALGRSVGLRVKPGWQEEGNLWTSIVGAPGTGKTPPLKAVCRPLYRIFEEQLRWHQVELEAAKARRREAEAERKKNGGKNAAAFDGDDPPPALKRVLVGDTTSEALGLRLRDNPRGLVLVLDELAGLVNGLNQYKTNGGNDQEFYLALWSRASYPIDRKGQDGGIPIYVRSPFFAVTGGIQPDKLDSIGTTKDGRRVNDGFLDRFLFAFPKEIPMRWTEECVSPETEGEWEAAVRRLWDRPMVADDDGYERPFWVDWTPDARQRFAAWFDENCKATGESDFPEEMKGPFSKVRAYCARLALVLEQLWWAFDPAGPDIPPRVSLRSVEGAIRLVEYFECHYRRVIAFISGTDGENPDAVAVMNWLASRQEPRFTVREAKDNFRRRFASKPEALEAALAWLEERFLVRKLPSLPHHGRGRKPTTAYETNPSLLLERAQNAQKK